jgi:hypothetical protein
MQKYRMLSFMYYRYSGGKNISFSIKTDKIHKNELLEFISQFYPNVLTEIKSRKEWEYESTVNFIDLSDQKDYEFVTVDKWIGPFAVWAEFVYEN